MSVDDLPWTAALDVPPLRQRRCDILPLWDQIIAAVSGDRFELTPEAQEKLLRQSWPGNIRELQHVAQRALLLVKGKVIGPANIEFDQREIATA